MHRAERSVQGLDQVCSIRFLRHLESGLSLDRDGLVRPLGIRDDPHRLDALGIPPLRIGAGRRMPRALPAVVLLAHLCVPLYEDLGSHDGGFGLAIHDLASDFGEGPVPELDGEDAGTECK
jgi:hypothetical protein